MSTRRGKRRGAGILEVGEKYDFGSSVAGALERVGCFAFTMTNVFKSVLRGVQ